MSQTPDAEPRGPRRGRTLVLLGALIAALAAYLVAATVSAQGRTAPQSGADAGASSGSITWDGKHGAENADRSDCSSSGGAYWLWILTPGGNKLASGTLTVHFASGATVVADGYHPGNGDGSLHFDINTSAPDTATSASVTFTYSGSKADKIVLTISHSFCTQGSSPSTSVPSASVPASGTTS